jgi:hypothetical protein
MKNKQIQEAPEDTRNGDISGGSYARERSSGVFNFKEGGEGKNNIDLLGKGEYSR